MGHGRRDRRLRRHDHSRISESTPPTRFASDVLAPQFEQLSGITVELEPTSWDEMYSKAINDMQAGTGIYDFVYIEQDIIYSYLANDYLVNLTQMLADNPDLASADFSFDKFTSFIDNFRMPTAISMACRWKPLSRSTCIAPTCSTTRRSRKL